LRRDLIAWYRKHQRRLPWRDTRDPYCIWVSEIMLQQTRVATVIGFYERWIKLFPNCERLASADVDDVLRAWEGLGYYSRARNLQRAAAIVVRDHGGRVPADVSALRQLPGIGAYSAGAIASIAHGAHEAAVDGNVIRVLSRLFCLEGSPRDPALLREVWATARRLLPVGGAGELNQALMELGATCCGARSPRCHECPVRRHCRALARDCVAAYPAAPPRATLLQRITYWL
jgi:A/G-specific adenine glycosylase